jgi:hypothetical protein
MAYVVDSLPDVPFSLGEMYAGLIPIDYNNKSNALFFIFQPTIGPPVDEVTIFLNGGRFGARLKVSFKRMEGFSGNQEHIDRWRIRTLGLI